MPNSHYLRAASLAEVQEKGVVVARVDTHTIALFADDGRVRAIDNRCPHLGFPLDRGSVECGILTCHWHHARFDLSSGGTFDPWADDVRAFPVRIDGDDVLVDVAPPSSPAADRFAKRLQDGLRQNLRLVIAKSVVGLQEAGAPEARALAVGASFGTRNARGGWGSALTILSAMANLLPTLDPEDRARALFHGLSRVAGESAGQSPAILPEPLETDVRDPATFVAWFRRFAEVRDRDGAERTLVTAVAVGLAPEALAEMLFSALTDHRYVDGGHSLDFANKAFELLDQIGWEHAATVLPSLVPRVVGGTRMEESASWRHPIDLVALLDAAFSRLPDAPGIGAVPDETALVDVLLGGDPAASMAALEAALASGAAWDAVAETVTLAAARRIAQFPVSNEFGDWDTALHTFTFANAVWQALRRAPSRMLLRGVFDAAMSVYNDRFLNLPATPLPRSGGGSAADPAAARAAFLDLLDRQQSVQPAGQAVSDWLDGGLPDDALLATLGAGLLREDADFHTIQCVEAAARLYAARRGTEAGRVALVAAGRYLAAHCPTSRAAGQTFRIARRMHRGEAVYEE